MQAISTVGSVINSSFSAVGNVTNIVDILGETSNIYAKGIQLDAELEDELAAMDREYKKALGHKAHTARMAEIGLEVPEMVLE